MISVVYCTRETNPEHMKHLKETCGVKNVEVIEYINHGESLTMFYNRGLKESKNDIVVFCHDDIIMNTKNWGKKLIKHFKNTDYGILGVAGTTDISESGRWWDDNTKMLGQVRHSNEGKSWDSKYSNLFGDKIMESAIVDGLFFAVDKESLVSHFDEDVKGFHFYELNFMLDNHLNGTMVGVVSDIRVTHKSIGQTNYEWEQNRLQFVEKYKEHLPINIKGEIWYNDKGIKLKEVPKISIIIPTKGNVNLLKDCVNSIYEKDDYPNLEVIIADTGSEEEELEEINKFIFGLTLGSGRNHRNKSNIPHDIKLIEYSYYNFAQINNDVVENHVSEDTELLLFCNNDIKLINNTITQMVNVYLKKKKDVGTIGARLHFEDDTIQHSGVIMFLNQNKQIGVSHHGLRSYYNYFDDTREVFGNTAAFMMTPKWLFDKVGGFNGFYEECFEDVEYNVECLNRNKKNYFVGNAVAYHLESQTRNKDSEKLKKESRDYTSRLIPTIMTSRKSWNYFNNIKAEDFQNLISQQV